MPAATSQPGATGAPARVAPDRRTGRRACGRRRAEAVAFDGRCGGAALPALELA